MMVQNVKCLLFLHLAGTKEYSDFVQKRSNSHCKMA